MTQLFNRKSTLLYRVFLLGSAGAILLLGGLAGAFKWGSFVTEVGVAKNQPVPFSHQHHVGSLGLDCRYCHTSVEKTASAGMPSTHTCMSCHSQIWQGAPMLEPVRQSYARNQPIRWNRVYRLPDYVYFNHSIHVTKGVGCVSCHGEVDEMPLLSKARTFYMRDCLSCHREPEKALRPREEVFNLHWAPPGDPLALGRKLVQEYHIPPVRKLTSCSTCHR